MTMARVRQAGCFEEKNESLNWNQGFARFQKASSSWALKIDSHKKELKWRQQVEEGLSFPMQIYYKFCELF